MSTDTYLKYHNEVKQIEDTKARLVWDLMSLEQHLDESHDRFVKLPIFKDH